MSSSVGRAHGKVLEVTFLFRIIKVAAATLGETGGDTVTMTLGLAYLFGSAIVVALFVAAVSVQIAATHLDQWLYWLVVVAPTTLGTTMADFADRSLAVGYTGGASILFAALPGEAYPSDSAHLTAMASLVPQPTNATS